MIKKHYTQRCPEYRVYEDEIQRRKGLSKVLNQENNKPDFHMLFFDKQGIKDQILLLKGDERGATKYDSLGRPLELGAIVWINIELSEIEGKFKTLCENAVQQGKEKPEEMPPDLLKQKILLEAKLYVSTLELERLELMLQSFNDVDQEKRRGNVLKNGPIGAITLRGGVASSVDNMRCEQISVKDDQGGFEKIVIISDPHPKAKPYNGLKISDYRKFVVIPWLRLCGTQLAKNRQEKNIDLAKVPNSFKRGLVPVPQVPPECKFYKKSETLKT